MHVDAKVGSRGQTKKPKHTQVYLRFEKEGKK
jgi:hypothetical protein